MADDFVRRRSSIRELSWLSLCPPRARARRGRCPSSALLERVKFAGISGHAARRVLHEAHQRPQAADRSRRSQARSRSTARTPAPRSSRRAAGSSCRPRTRSLAKRVLRGIDACPALAKAEGLPILRIRPVSTSPAEKEAPGVLPPFAVQPILTPLAVDAEHPFPFISNMSFNLAVLLPSNSEDADRFVRIKVPDNRPRWVPLANDAGFVPLEQVIAANLDLVFPGTPRRWSLCSGSCGAPRAKRPQKASSTAPT